MHEAVSDILLERSRESDRVGQMMLISSLAHAVLLAALVVGCLLLFTLGLLRLGIVIAHLCTTHSVTQS